MKPGPESREFNIEPSGVIIFFRINRNPAVNRIFECKRKDCRWCGKAGETPVLFCRKVNPEVSPWLWYRKLPSAMDKPQ